MDIKQRLQAVDDGAYAVYFRADIEGTEPLESWFIPAGDDRYGWLVGNGQSTFMSYELMTSIPAALVSLILLTQRAAPYAQITLTKGDRFGAAYPAGEELPTVINAKKQESS